MPGGKAVLFSIGTRGSTENAQIAVLSLETGEQKLLLRGGSNPHYVPTGHLVYGVDGTLWAVPFDLGRLEVTGDPVPVLTNVVTKDSGAANVAFSMDGSLVYVGGTTASTVGRATPLTEVTADYHQPRFAPDGQRIAVAIAELQGDISASDADIWVLYLDRGARTNLTSEGNNFTPTWSPDGRRVAFSVSRPGRTDIFWAPADGSGPPEGLLVEDGDHRVTSWSPDGRTLAYYEFNPNGLDRDLWVLSLDGDPTPSPFLVGRFDERASTFSPDGRWLAYVSDKSGQSEVYVRPYPGPGGEAIVSTDGGSEPVWAPDGSELFYRNGAQMLVARVESDPTFSTRPPELLFEAGYALEISGRPNYDISPDGQQFVMVKMASESAGESAQINIIQSWFEELKERVPIP